jgi:hypothetical protein
MASIGRNDPCPCGSGKKHKKCCLLTPRESASPAREAIVSQPTPSVSAVRGKPSTESADTYRPSLYAMAARLELPESFSVLPEPLRSRFVENLRARWTPARVFAMSTEEILAKLAGFGVTVTEASFAAESEGSWSATAIGQRWSERAEVSKSDADFVWLAAVALWRRWSPARPSHEMVEDLVREGNSLFDAGSYGPAFEALAQAWELVADRLRPEDRDARRETSAYEGYFPLHDWLETLVLSTLRRPPGDAAEVERATRLLQRIVTQFTDGPESLLVVSASAHMNEVARVSPERVLVLAEEAMARWPHVEPLVLASAHFLWPRYYEQSDPRATVVRDRVAAIASSSTTASLRETAAKAVARWDSSPRRIDALER